MISLEDAVYEVRTLSEGLDAKVILKTGHYESTYTPGHQCTDANSNYHCGAPNAPGCPIEVWVPDTLPDTEKILTTVEQLRAIYEHSPWYAARDDAAFYLTLSDALTQEERQRAKRTWVEELRGALNPKSTPSIKERIAKVEDAKHLVRYDSFENRSVLWNAYTSDPDRAVQAAAGRALDLPWWKIYLHTRFGWT